MLLNASSRPVSYNHVCMRPEWCTSTNSKLSSKNSCKGTCELNKHDISHVNENTVFQEHFDVFDALKWNNLPTR